MLGRFGRAVNAAGAVLFNYEGRAVEPAVRAGAPHTPTRSTDPDNRRAVDELFGDDGFLIPSARSFTGMYNTFSKVFSYRYDEAMRHYPENARSMRRDTFFSALMQERTRPLVNHAWEVVLDEDNPPDAKDDPDAEKVRLGLEGVVRRTHAFHEMRDYQTEDLWYGRYGSQVIWGDDEIGGFRRKVIKRHTPVDGDNIYTTFEGDPAVAISSMDLAYYRRHYGDDLAVTTDRQPVLKLSRPDLRQRFVFQRHMVRAGDYYHPETAGRLGGVGLRDLAYWSWWMRQEMLASAVSFLDKIGTMGLLLFYYQLGNPQSEENAKENAKNANRRNALAIGLPQGKDAKTGGVDILPANMAGVQFLTQFIGDYFEGHIERLFVGQRSSASNEGAGLGGTSMADFQKDTKHQLLRSDASRHSHGYTQDLLSVAKELNFPDAPWRYRFNLVVDDPRAGDKLEMIVKAHSIGVSYDEDRVRAVTGEPVPPQGANLLSKRADEDRAADRQAQAGMMGGLGMPGSNGREGAGAPHKSPDGGDSDDESEGSGEPVPGMAELVAAMFQAASEGDTLSVDRLAELGQNPEELAKLVGGGLTNYEGPRVPPRPGLVWKDETKRWIRPEEDKPKPKGGEKPQETAKRLKAEREPGRQEARETWQKAYDDPGSVTPKELASLADQLKRLTRDELREKVRSMGQRVGGLKHDLVERMLDHVRGVKPDQKEPPKKARKGRSDSFASLVKSFGGINPNDHAFKTIYGSMSEAIENGIPLMAFSKEAGGLDVLAEQLANNGYMTVPENRHATEYLLEKIAEKHRAGIQDDAAEYEDAYNQYLLAEEEARHGTSDPRELEALLLRSEADARREVTESILGNDPAEHRGSDPDSQGERGDSDESDLGNSGLDSFFDFLEIEPPEEKPKALRSVSTDQRDIFGNTIKGPAAVRRGQQLSLDDAHRELDLQKAEEFAAEKGLPITERGSGGRFKIGGEWHRVGKAEDGYPIKKEPVDIDDSQSFVEAVFRAGASVQDWMGNSAKPGRASWDKHQPMISDVYRHMVKTGSISDEISLNQFKAALLKAQQSGHAVMNRLDMADKYQDRVGKDRHLPSEVTHLNATFHRINVPAGYDPA